MGDGVYEYVVWISMFGPDFGWRTFAIRNSKFCSRITLVLDGVPYPPFGEPQELRSFLRIQDQKY